MRLPITLRGGTNMFELVLGVMLVVYGAKCIISGLKKLFHKD